MVLHSTESSIPPVTEDDIADYLANTPDFFDRHASVFSEVRFKSPHGNRAVSLQERQAEMLREKIKTLELRVMDMMHHGRQNSDIAERLQEWTRVLLLARITGGLPDLLEVEIAKHFHVPQVALRMWDVAPEYADALYTQGVSEGVRTFASSLSMPYCGANSGLEAVQWLKAPTDAKSLALIPLRGEGEAAAFGLLALASDDAARFTADMGTSFLVRIGIYCSAALSRLRPEQA